MTTNVSDARNADYAALVLRLGLGVMFLAHGLVLKHFTFTLAGTLAGAARVLGVNHATVFRRLNGFEDRLGVRLFERLRSGYVLTVAGEEMRAPAARIEAEVERLDRRISGRDLRLGGPVVVTTTDTLASRFLGPHFAAFKDAHPGIDLELVLDTQYVNLSKRQADVAVRPTLTPPETLVGRRVATIAFAPYAAPAYLDRVDRGRPLADHDWLMLDESLAHLAAAAWARDHLAAATVRLRANNLLGLEAGAVAAMGAALLPCFMGDPEAGLKRLAPPIESAASALWLLTHQDLRRTARIRAFIDFMAKSIAADRAVLEGTLPAAL